MSEGLHVRATLFDTPRHYRVEGDTLTVTPTAKDGAPASPPEAVPLREVVELHLCHNPARFQFNRFRCTVKTRGGAVHAVTNVFYERAIAEKDTSAEYRAFVHQLCRGVAAANPQARFRRGRSRASMIAQIGGLLLLGAAVVGVGVWLRSRRPWTLLAGLALLVVYVPLAFISLQKNRPGAFDPLAVPPEIVPK